MSRAFKLLPSFVFLLLSCKEGTPLNPAPRPAKLDSTQLARVVSGLEAHMARAEATGLLELDADSAEAVEKRDALRSFFAGYLDFIVTLDGMREGLNEARGKRLFDSEIFLLSYAADLSMYVNTAKLLSKATGERSYEKIFDEPAPRFGIAKGDFRRLKTAFTLQPVDHPLALAHALHKTLKPRYAERGLDKVHGWALDYIDRRSDDMFELGVKKNPKIVAKEWADLAKSGFAKVWFPGQKHVATWLGDTKVRRKTQSLINRAQINELRKVLRPGDILVERRNWYLSNVGLPGFWTHAALYLGTPAELEAALGKEALEGLRTKNPKVYERWASKDEGHHEHRVIEAVSEGVIFTSLEHTADADYFGALRPKTDDKTLVTAIDRALGYFGRPYDFDFDFLSDRSLVCTELVYKAYEIDEKQALELPLVEVLGRPTLPANELVRFFDERADSDKCPLEFVTFLDGREKEGRAIAADLASFRKSYTRPRWDLIQQ